MLHFVIILSLLFSVVSAKPPLEGQWQLSLNEDFDTPLNLDIWNTELETGKLRYRRSKCFFRSENVLVKDGNLLLITKKQKLKLMGEDGKFHKLKYSSGMVNTFRKFRQKYGYFEARIKLPSARGLWPAFWMMPDRSFNANGPLVKGMRSTKLITNATEFTNGQGMELDIMEYLTEWKRKKIHWAAHWDGYSEDLKSYHGYHKVKGKFSDDFHTYSLYWDKGVLIWYFDGEEISRLESDRVSDVASYLILSTNLGGWATWRRETDKMPEQTVIDYVKVWKRLP